MSEERFDKIDGQFAEVDARFDRVDAKFVEVDARFDGIDARLDRVDARLNGLEAAVEEVQAGQLVMRSEQALMKDELIRRMQVLHEDLVDRLKATRPT